MISGQRDGKISSTADDWEAHWRAYAPSAEFNPAQAFRRDLICALIRARAADAARFVDLGSGQGDLAGDLRKRLPSADILGLELSATGVDLSRQKVPAARFLQWNLLNPTEPPDEFRRWAQVAVCSEVLEHVDDPAALLRNARRFLAPGCLVIVTVPGGPMSSFDRHIGHRRHYTADSIGELLRGAGLAVEFAAGAGFPFFNLYRLAVIARGRRLVESARADSLDRLSVSEAMVLRCFRRLFGWHHARGKWGWQILACARENESR